MDTRSALGAISQLSATSLGVFRGGDALASAGLCAGEVCRLAGVRAERPEIMAAWDKVTRHPNRLLDELAATRAA